LVAYLFFAPPVLVFGPLAGLLLLSGPRSIREWLWLLATGTWSALWLDHSGGLAGQFARAETVLITGSFLALTLWRPSARFSRALAATAIGSVALVIWMGHFGVGWTAVQAAVEQDLWRSNRDLIMRLGQVAPAMNQPGMLDQMTAMVRTIALLYPALLALASMGGVTLAWVWHRRIARRPLGPAPAGFSAFEFSDQLVWGWVLGLALCLAPLPPVWKSVGANLLLVWAVLYAVRGLAVFAVGTRRVPGPVIATLSLVAMFLLPFVVGGLTLLGLADTWLDFRRRLAASAT
jgi:uncharacterized protein YybS (DUF2232 family)